MNITNYAIKNYQFTLIMVLMVAVLGASSLLNMPRAEDPEMHAPLYPVTVIYPGTSPKDMEELVVKPLEQEIYSLDGIEKIKTTISDGLAVLLVEFEYKSDVDVKHQELSREINSMREKLPQDIYRLEVDKFAPSDVNILQMELVSENASTDNLRKYARNLKEELEKVTDLKGVEVQGISDRIIRVDLNMSKMANLKIPLDGVSKAIESELVKIPGGLVFEGNKSFNIKTDGNLSSVEDIANIIISGSKSGNIQLKDIAEVYTDYSPPTHIVRLNGFRAVTVIAALKEGKNITQTQEQYLAKIDEFKQTLPANIDLILHFDQADNVNQRLSGLGIDFSIAIFLVLLTLLPLGNRASLVVMFAIPLSLAIGIVVLDFFDFSLNQLSIVGFVVSLGLLVDDS
ncbi:MAG TPA: efflux RND transporter permease subunit, partial [Flavobacteriaceae bacterium]|nr:efflux RND transporter permease subunit [Flavobacteriaceae bacterium]